MKQTKFAWSDFFSGNIEPTLGTSQYNSQQRPSGTNVYVSKCLFRSITSTGSGGALYCTSVTDLLVESSSFFSCKTSAHDGGAIYLSTKQCVLHEVCGYDCYSTHGSYPYYQFAYVSANNVASNKNYVNHTSIARCVTDRTTSFFTLALDKGNVCCISVNISLTKCQYHSPLHCIPYVDSSSVTCSLLYSTFADNIAFGHVCISFENSAKYEIKCCNILRNTESSSGTDGIIWTRGSVNIYDSCILENTATYIFYQYSSYTITLSNCTVDKTSNNGYLSIRNTVSKSFILALNHMSTRNCNAEYDSAGYLTPIIQTPIIQTPSSSKKQIHLCTCGKIFYHSQIRDFVSLLRVFIFHFIHLEAPTDPLY
jgi:predicted outer membrane repeat protein